jgi:hypothetical protein
MKFSCSNLLPKHLQAIESFVVYSKVMGYSVDFCVMFEDNFSSSYDTIIIQKSNSKLPIVVFLFSKDKNFKMTINHGDRQTFPLSDISSVFSSITTVL